MSSKPFPDTRPAPYPKGLLVKLGKELALKSVNAARANDLGLPPLKSLSNTYWKCFSQDWIHIASMHLDNLETARHPKPKGQSK